MGYDVNAVIKIATAEIGYQEKSAAAYKADPTVLDRPHDGAGRDNYTKYGRDMHKIYPAVMDFPAAWCDCFVDWCFYKAYGIATAKSLLGGNFDDYTVASAQMYKAKGALDHNPKVGDQVFYSKTQGYTGCYHTGLVIAVNGSKITTIEGNTSGGSGIVADGGAVVKKTRTVTSKMLFGHPNYDAETAKMTTPTYAVGQTYTLQVELNVRRGAGTNYGKKSHTELTASGQTHDVNGDGALDKGTRVTCLEVRTVESDIWIRCPSGWLAAYYNGKTYIK